MHSPPYLFMRTSVWHDLNLRPPNTTKDPRREYTTLLVKLMRSRGLYSVTVHQTLRPQARLFGTLKYEGAPDAVVMEYLSSKDWMTLYDYQWEKSIQKEVVDHPRLLEAFKLLKSHWMVHGDLGPMNILVRRGRAWDEMEFKVINVDWVGERGAGVAIGYC